MKQFVSERKLAERLLLEILHYFRKLALKKFNLLQEVVRRLQESYNSPTCHRRELHLGSVVAN